MTDHLNDPARVRHDLLNVMTALRSGCLLIEAELAAGGSAEAREVLEQMRAEIEKGTRLLRRLRGVEADGD